MSVGMQKKDPFSVPEPEVCWESSTDTMMKDQREGGEKEQEGKKEGERKWIREWLVLKGDF